MALNLMGLDSWLMSRLSYQDMSDLLWSTSEWSRHDLSGDVTGCVTCPKFSRQYVSTKCQLRTAECLNCIELRSGVGRVWTLRFLISVCGVGTGQLVPAHLHVEKAYPFGDFSA